MEQLFLKVLNMSMVGGIVILCVLVARLLLKKAPKFFSYLLWSVVLFRLVCPISFESMLSLLPINQNPITPNIIYSAASPVNSGTPILDSAPFLPPVGTVGTADSGMNPMQILMLVLQIVWLVGIAALLCYSVISFLRLKRSLRCAVHISDNIYEDSALKTAFVLGLIKPRIYLPTGLSENERLYILKHEQTHIKRLDHLIKPLAFLVLCVHWFNPLVWVAFILCGKDMEMSCDEAVVKQLGSDIKQDYSTSLLALSSRKRFLNGSPLAFGENDTKGRIKNILNYKKACLLGNNYSAPCCYCPRYRADYKPQNCQCLHGQLRKRRFI